jgi:hypothetical protein
MQITERESRDGRVYLVDLDVQRLRHVVTNEFEARIGQQMLDVALLTGEQVVNTNDLLNK